MTANGKTSSPQCTTVVPSSFHHDLATMRLSGKIKQYIIQPINFSDAFCCMMHLVSSISHHPWCMLTDSKLKDKGMPKK